MWDLFRVGDYFIPDRSGVWLAGAQVPSIHSVSSLGPARRTTFYLPAPDALIALALKVAVLDPVPIGCMIQAMFCVGSNKRIAAHAFALTQWTTTAPMLEERIGASEMMSLELALIGDGPDIRVVPSLQGYLGRGFR